VKKVSERTKCWKCNGTGEYKPFGTCYACSGTGIAKPAARPTAWWTKECICVNPQFDGSGGGVEMLCHVHSYDECIARRTR
jgi:DnaJ-class molecular chaperone